MVTRLTTEDLPAPWLSSRKTTPGTRRRKATVPEVSPVEDANVYNQRVEPRKRGRPAGKSPMNVVASPKGMKRKTPLPASAVNVLLGVSQNSVADVHELRRKRVEDTGACGRTVRTMSSVQKRSSPNTLLKNCSEKQQSNGSIAGTSKEDASTHKFSEILRPTDEIDGYHLNAMKLLEEVEDKGEPIFSHRPGKEPLADDVEDGIALPVHNESHPRRIEAQLHIESDEDLQGRNRQQRCPQRRHDRSPSTENSRERYEGRRKEMIESADEGLFSYRKGIYENRSPARNLCRSGRFPESWSPGRSKCRSPATWSEGGPENTGHDYQQYYDYPYSHRFAEENVKSSVFYTRGHCHRGQGDSSSSENRRRRRRFVYRERTRHSQQSRSTPYSRAYSSMSPPRTSKNSRDSRANEWTDYPVLKNESIVDMSPASDRRRRRHQQALLEADTVRRQENGNKPFYLTLDREGRPHGPGRPSWIAQINKLAIGLDPSCTHIKKQSFEDVQTFKGRLDEKFEYSGTLNEDYLRALMGKAVTKRRSELIAFIKNDGMRPVHIDYEVWRRLEKLAESKQREDKSEQGRHANACRKTLGRTSCRGIVGVQEMLRSLLGRSPDPSEVEEEMQRDKGYGGQSRKKRVRPMKEEMTAAEVCLFEEGNPSSGSRSNAHPSNVDAGCVEPCERHPRGTAEKSELGGRKVLQELNVLPGLSDDVRRSSTIPDSNTMPTDKYIAILEAEIKHLKAQNAKSLSSSARFPSEPTMPTQWQE